MRVSSKIVQRLLLLLCLAPLTASQAQDSLDNARNPDSLDGGASQSEFLRVDEAYQLSVAADDETLTLHWDIADDYYLYKDNFEVAAYSDGREIPLELSYQEGTVTYDEYFEKDMEVFYEETDLEAPLPEGVESMQLAITSQGCADAGLCYPPHTENWEVDLTDGSAAEIPAITAKPDGDGSGGGPGGGSTSEAAPLLGYTLLLAFAGGIILNLMPCVFPVLSIKAMSLVSNADEGHQHRLHGWAYTLGVVLSFIGIGAVIVAIRAAGGQADWGKQLQSPIFVALMFYLFLVMGLSLSGFVQFGGRLMGVGQSLTTRQGLQGSFFTGVLAVVVASPCTAPFMATALGVALTQPTPVALAVFAALGLGMALPFLALSYSPRLSRMMPKPGPWMENLKQFLAFPLYLTAVWLIWVLGRQTSVDAAAAVAAGAVIIAFALWLMQYNPASRWGRWLVKGGGALALILAVGLAFRADTFVEDDIWQPYSADRLEELQREGHPVFVNLTAAWCITCQANERVALGRDAVLSKARELDIALVKGDWTNEDPRITELLHEYDRVGVPTYLMYPADPDKRAEVLPQILTPDIVIEAMERAAGSGADDGARQAAAAR